MPAKGSPEWERIARDYSPEEWEAKEAARKRAHDTAMNEALVQCIVLATEFAKLRDQEMAPYLVERPDPHRWRNLTAFVGRRKLQRVKEMAEDLHWAQVDREDYLSHMRDE